MKTFSHFAALAMVMAAACGGAESGQSSSAAMDPMVANAEDSDGVQQKIEQKALVTPVTGTIDGVAFSGILRVTQFVAGANQILAVANLTQVTGELSQVQVTSLQAGTYQLPVHFAGQPQANNGESTSAALAPCDVLFLQLGPLDLDLLGLVVHLDQVTLDIDAQAGGGNLLGNLLCAITELLDPVAFLQNILQIVNLLNQVIDLIGQI
jgi:hypothetical protein